MGPSGATAIWVIVVLLLLFGVMVAILFFGWLSTKKKVSYVLSPYAKVPVRPLLSVNFLALQKIEDFIETLPGYDNRMFNFKRSVYCRETGRIFFDCVDWKGKVSLDWSFLQQRHRGSWVSWGSLREEKQREFKEKHESLKNFQVELSCPNLKPEEITDEYLYVKPGPLYADLLSYKLLGWQIVPGTDFEVLVLQLPKKIFVPKQPPKET